MNNKSSDYTFLKVICTLLVVIGHAAVMYTGNGVVVPASGSRIISYLSQYIYSFHMPLFFVISGAVYNLCIEKGKYKNNLKFITLKAKRLLIPYFAFGLLYITPVMLFLGFDKSSYFSYAVNGILLSRNSRHLWFILTLFWIFLSTVMVRHLFRKIPAFIQLMISAAVLVFSFKVSPDFQLRSAMYYQFYFYSGCILDRYFDSIAGQIKKLRCFVFVLPMIQAVSLFIMQTEYTKIIFSLTGILMMLSISVLFDFTKLKESKLYKISAKNSFGIYLFHPMLLYFVYYYVGVYAVNPYLLTSAAVIAAAAVSISATELLRKAKLQMLIGE